MCRKIDRCVLFFEFICPCTADAVYRLEYEADGGSDSHRSLRILG